LPCLKNFKTNCPTLVIANWQRELE
jgi:hypothetical protein